MSVKKIILISLTGILFITYIIQLKLNSKTSVKQIKTKTAIEKIQISNYKGNISLSKENENWQINSKFPANKELCEYILEQLSNVKILDTVSKTSNEADIEKYGFNNPIQVTGFSSQNQEVQKIIIGKTSTTGNQTYVKFKNENEIYLASGNLVLAFNISENDISDFTLYSVLPNDIYKIAKYNGEVSEINKEFELEKTGELASVNWNVNGNPISPEKIEDWIATISFLNASEWIEDFDNLQNQTNDLTIVLGAAGIDITISLYNTFEQEEKVLCICSANPYPCYISKTDADNFIKSLSDFE